MAQRAFSERRRELRSSRPFHLVLGASLLFCLLVSWLTARTGSMDTSGAGEDRLLGNAVAAVRSTHNAVDHLHSDTHPKEHPLKGTSDSKGVSASPSGTVPLRIISYNIRYATKNPVLGERPWTVRRPKLCAQLRFITAGQDSPFLCLQESLYSQVIDVQSCLGPSWSYIGRGRGDGETDGEFSPIFYRSETWAHVRSETRWLSETPLEPSRGWDAALNRIVTIGKFTHKVTGATVVVMSTHFDHVGVLARQNSAELLIRLAAEWGRDRPSALLVAGDLNSTPDEGAYTTMTASGSGMSDIADLLPVEEHYGNHLTYTTFGEPSEWPKRIDFIFIQEPRTAVVTTFGVLPSSFDDQIRCSDHRPVVADLAIVP